MKMFLFRKYELTARHKEYFELRRLRWRHKDIAVKWGVTVGHVKNISYEANKRLRIINRGDYNKN